jgi:hypothetical protein
LVESLALHYLGACVGQEPFAHIAEVTIDYVADDSIEHSVAKELKSLVVDETTLLRPM